MSASPERILPGGRTGDSTLGSRGIGVRPDGEVRVASVQVAGDRPTFVDVVMGVALSRRKTVFDDAAGVHIGKRESFRKILEAAGFDDGLLERFAFEIHDAAVGMDGTAADIQDVHLLLVKGKFDVGFAGAFLSKYFDADVFADRGFLGIHIARAIENHGVGAGLRGIVFQRQVGGKNGKPIIAGGGGAWSDGSGAEKQQHKGNTGKNRWVRFIEKHVP